MQVYPCCLCTPHKQIPWTSDMGALSKQIQPTLLQQADEIMLFLCFKLCYL